MSYFPVCESKMREAFAAGVEESMSSYDFVVLAKRVAEEENAKLNEATMRDMYEKRAV